MLCVARVIIADQGRSQNFFSTEAKETSAERPKSRSQAQEWGGILGKGQPAPPHQLGGLGSAVSSPAGSGAERRPPNDFHAF